MSTMKQNVEAMATRISTLAGLDNSITPAQLATVIAALGVDEDLRIIFNFGVLMARSSKEFHDARERLGSDDESNPH